LAQTRGAKIEEEEKGFHFVAVGGSGIEFGKSLFYKTADTGGQLIELFFRETKSCFQFRHPIGRIHFTAVQRAFIIFFCQFTTLLKITLPLSSNLFSNQSTLKIGDLSDLG
jgi:hypothetical protein